MGRGIHNSISVSSDTLTIMMPSLNDKKVTSTASPGPPQPLPCWFSLTYVDGFDFGLHLHLLKSMVVLLVPIQRVHLVGWLDTLFMGNDRRLRLIRLHWALQGYENSIC